ncbi:TetR/AcrR family transcriptional regulator [Jiella marina]|uniref:TetR/AcrR family transcriptional regulator n=1 Tax=Jiella sp. LLJ827 TaxID=2917712 RepID=UPI002101CC47|nr:TetR/AcrR family transcriptional regulator [Jiella sp. LLJ827]MCQ0986916.1 TetR/AcrR family transcriptional regulator [Jiella sp. LLJ827]
MLKDKTSISGQPKADTKQAIERAALSLFAERGYPAVSMREIAERVGIRQGGIYNHFASKQALLVQLMEGHMRALLVALDASVPSGGDPRQRLGEFVRFHVLYHLTQPDDVFIAYMELRSLEPAGLSRLKELRRAYEERLRGILEAGRRLGVFAVTDVPVQAMGLIAMLTGVTTWYRDGGRLSRDEVAEIYVAMAMQSLGVEETPTM